MRLRSLIVWARIGERGGLKIPDRVSQFASMHKGRSVLIRVEVQSLEPTERMTNYFFGYVVKEMRRAYESIGECLSEQETYDRIRSNCPLFLEEKREKGEWKTRVMEWEDLSIEEAVEAISWIQRWASMEFQWIIDDPL